MQERQSVQFVHFVQFVQLVQLRLLLLRLGELGSEVELEEDRCRQQKKGRRRLARERVRRGIIADYRIAPEGG